MADSKRYGLVVTTEGLSSGHVTFPGVKGFYYPGYPTPVGEPGDPLTLQEAKDLAGPKAGLEVVEIPASRVTEVENYYEQAVNDQRSGVQSPPPTRAVSVEPAGGKS